MNSGNASQRGMNPDRMMRRPSGNSQSPQKIWATKRPYAWSRRNSMIEGIISYMALDGHTVNTVGIDVKAIVTDLLVDI